jgi:hypothetical protein
MALALAVLAHRAGRHPLSLSPYCFTPWQRMATNGSAGRVRDVRVEALLEVSHAAFQVGHATLDAVTLSAQKSVSMGVDDNQSSPAPKPSRAVAE